MSNLKTVVDRLRSEKVKERQEGIAALRSTFAREDAVYSIEDGRGWLVLYQALFTTVKVEKLDTAKKLGKAGTAGAAAQRRLVEAAAAVRWLVERSVRCLSKRALTPLLEHLTQMLVHRHELFSPIALDYLKTIRVLLSWTPHMDHVNLETWLKLVEICFNVVLNEPMDKELVPSEEDNSSGENSMYQCDSNDDDAGSSSTPAQTRKRHLAERATPGSTDSSHRFRRSARRTVSLEQVECTALLALLFRHPAAPFLATVDRSDPDRKGNLIPVPVASALFKRMKRFLECYPTDTSLHHDYLLALRSFLSQVSLNCKDEVDDLARSSWDALVGLWGTKNKQLKESLVGIFRILFPFITAAQSAPSYGWADAVQNLLVLLNGEAESKWGIDGLFIDSLRLDVSPAEVGAGEIFVSHTFRAGWNFDTNQALAWTLLELQADCIEKLFKHSESVHVGTPSFSSTAKRMKREDPISALLQSIRSTSTTNVRVYNLQILLFLIDRHWAEFHNALQNDIINVLLQLISVDDVSIQSWIFLSLAAVARWDGEDGVCRSGTVSATALRTDRRGPTTWDPIWTHAVRRANVPVVCRAACHTAYLLIGHAKHLLTSHRVLAEIETFAKDLDLQGPNFPYDAVCMFLAQCLRVASQDVRLYRMQLEEKVLSWLLDNWGIGVVTSNVSGKARLPPHTINDFLNLLGSICGYRQHTDLICASLLPDCEIAEVMEEQRKTKIIRDYLLFAKLPQVPHCKGTVEDVALVSSDELPSSRLDQEPVSPRGRERRVSIFLHKAIESLVVGWEVAKVNNFTHAAAEEIRQSLDVAITAIIFDSLQASNGTRSNRRVVQLAGKVVVLLAPLLTDSRWTAEERLLILKAFDPLILDGDSGNDDEEWEAMVVPSVDSGIRSHILNALRARLSREVRSRVQRRSLQRMIWRNADIQDDFAVVFQSLNQLLCVLIDQVPHDEDSNADEEGDRFEPIRTTRAAMPADDGSQDHSLAVRRLVEICVIFLSVVPALQNPAGEVTHNKELVKVMTDCSEEKLLVLGPPLLTVVCKRLLNLNAHILDTLLGKCADLLQRYSHAFNAQFHLLVTDLLKCTMHIWLEKKVAGSALGDHVLDLCAWISGIARKKVTFWKVRDLVVQFTAMLLAEDPSQSFWPAEDGEESVSRPLHILLALNADEDIRVRFRAAVKTANLFALREDDGTRDFGNLDSFYTSVHESLPRDLAKCEHMFTRSLCLGNIMIASSYVRRGPYWHLLEVAFHSPSYARHIQVVLNGVSMRLGLSDSHELFEAYASQIAFSIRQNFYDVLRLPPSLLGYDNRRACAEAAFRLCTPANLMVDGGSDAVAHGRTLFNNHCTAIQKTVHEGLLKCVGDLIGLQLVCFMDRPPGNSGSVTQQLREVLTSIGLNFPSQEAFVECVRENVAGIAVAIIRSLGDQDFSERGAIVTALRKVTSTDTTGTFLSLNQYRQLGDFRYHPPNLPRFGTGTVLRALQWCISSSKREDAAAISFHVLHQLFSELHLTPFVNEQHRLLNGIALLVSVRHCDFGDPTLLHTFVQKSSLLLAQSDLITAGQSFLEWGFSIFRKTHQVDQRLPNILAHVCALVGDLQSASTSASATAGKLRSWLDEQALSLSQDQKIRSFVLKALPVWSHEPSSELSALVEDLSADDLSATLSDHRITSNKFRLVRQLNRLAEQHSYCRVRFSTSDFWRLKDNIPPKGRLSRGDIDAFASLLIANAGNIYSFRSEPAFPRTLRARHCRGTKRQEDEKTEPAPQHAILQTLLAMLDDGDPSEVNLVYLALRSLISVASPGILSFQLWPTEYRTPIEYFQRFPVPPPNARQARTIDQLDAIWPQNADFPQWICSVTTLLADILASKDDFYAQLVPLLQRNTLFAEEVLPVLVHTLLQAERARAIEVSARKGLSDYFTNVLRAEEVNRLCLRAIVDVILHLRNFEPSNSTDQLAHDKWLDVDFHLLARSAVTCGAYTTALLFLELACEYQQLNMDATGGVEHLLFDIYSHIDEPDGFYGIKTTDLRHFLIKRFHHEKQWEKAFRFHGAALEADNHGSIDADGLLQSFHAFGFDHLALRALQSSQGGIDSDVGSSTMSYQLGWRTETWDLPDSGQQDSSTTLYRALRAVHRERNHKVVDATINQALCDMMERLLTLGNEDITEIREVGRNFMCLSQITRWRSGKLQEYLDSKTSDARAFSHLVDIDPDFEFLDLERILATRLSLVRSVRQKEEREQIGELISPFTRTLIDVEKRCLVRLSVAARKSDQLQVALNSIVKAQQLEKTPSYEISQEFANVLWLQREQKLAVQFLKDLLSQKKAEPGSKPTIEEAMTMARLGSWISEACMEKPTDIKQNLFDAAVQVAACAEKRMPTRSDSCASIYHKCAQFAERQYHAILKSPDGVRWKVYVDRKRQEIKQMETQLRGTQMSSHDYGVLVHEQTKARALLAEDEDAYERYNGALVTFLESAIDMYSRCLAASDGFDDDVPIRFSSLWFANFDDERLQKGIMAAVDRIPSRKFVFLSHQLSARISRPIHGEMPKSQQILQRLVLRMCQEHPFHSLYQVYCIRPEGSVQSGSMRRTSSRLESPTSQTDRGLAASHIFDVLLADPNHSARTKAIEQVCNASLQWAKYPIKELTGKKTNIILNVPEGLLIRQLRNIHVPVLTSHPPIDPTLRYDNCVWISHYDKTFQPAGGVNMPKINTCYGTDGQRFKQLFKGEGNDDLRQDAVMEQVFDLVNTVLRHDRETKRRDLKVRGYTVLPLAPQAGVIEFVGNTSPLASWLQPAHKRYRPNDMDHHQATRYLSQTREKYKGKTEALVAAFSEICRRIQPVMRHYFPEKSKTPIAWFAMRLNYTRSVATTSIVGHVLGLGDRHISNILLDNRSGEVVHIDLGIAFDQGKRLPVPERVPFRMTRDMVDGMGYSGTQGVFQRCAEETLRVLREQSDVVMTVLEVFKHDPLHSWTASELKLKKIQESAVGPPQQLNPLAERPDFDMKSGSAEAAERALGSVARKLDKSLSVECTVNELIAEATDVVNLATIYYGWSPDL